MKLNKLPFYVAMVLVAVVVSPSLADPIHGDEIKHQTDCYKRWWGANFEWRFDHLPKSGMAPQFRIPYAGCIYPDNAGGCWKALRKYDQAFHRGYSRAESYERHDIAMHQESQTRQGGLFGLMTYSVRATPHWAGHCNGWTAAAIRHAEPTKVVVRNGVKFYPADIKGLLAELYVYTDTEFLGGVDHAINPGTFHVVLANWLGRGQFPIGMDSFVGHEVWNYPIYAYSSAAAKRGPRQVEVRTNIGYVYMLDREHHKAPRNYRFKKFHYMLTLNEHGQVIGGEYYNDSDRIDMLWAPLAPTQGGTEGNEKGNPHVDAKTVLALWRESVSEDLRNKWYNIDPTWEDRILDEPQEEAAENLVSDGEAADESESPAETSEPAEQPSESPTETAPQTAPAAESREVASVR